MERFGAGYLEERSLVKRWPQPIPAIVSLALTLVVFYATWWIFQDPRGWLRMYTPYVGYMYTRWWLIMLIWMVYIFNYWPFKRSWLERTHPLIKGVTLREDGFPLTRRWRCWQSFSRSCWCSCFGLTQLSP